MLWLWTDASYKHLRYENAVAISKKVVRRLWGSDKTMRNIVGINYFSVLEGNNLSGVCNAFTPSSELLEALLLCLQDEELATIVGQDLVPMRIPKQPFSSRRGYGNSNSSWSGIKTCRFVPINVDNLKTVLNDPSFTFDAQKAAWRLIRLANNNKCLHQLPVTYKEMRTGRIFEDSFQLQNSPRQITKAAFAGNWDYDIANCHFAILHEWARTLGLSAPVISSYLANKNEFRAELASLCRPELELADSIALVKKALLGLLYGAYLSEDERFSIGKTLGKQGASRFNQHDLVRRLNAEIKSLRTEILNDLPTNKGLIVNWMGITVSTKDPKEMLCHVLQGVEALILRAIAKEYGQDIILFMHDGWISKRELEIHHIQSVIKNVTRIKGRDGFNLDVEHSFLAPLMPIKAPEMQSHLNKKYPETIASIRFKEIIDENRARNTPPRLGGLVLSLEPAWARLEGISGPRTPKLKSP